MKLTKSQIAQLLNHEGNEFSVAADGLIVAIKRLQLYAAFGFMETSGETIVSFDALGCPCIPGSDCYPKCAQ
jgi:hypothetical protein